MTVYPPRSDRHLMASATCGWCRQFPCVCRRESPCMCGGTIYATSDVAGSLAKHQAEPQHADWRARNGL